MNRDFNKVYINSKKLARIRAELAPKIPTKMNNGISTYSKNTYKSNSTLNTAIISSSSTNTKYYLTLCHEASTAIGIVHFVSNTKSNDSPSIPKCK